MSECEEGCSFASSPLMIRFLFLKGREGRKEGSEKDSLTLAIAAPGMDQTARRRRRRRRCERGKDRVGRSTGESYTGKTPQHAPRSAPGLKPERDRPSAAESVPGRDGPAAPWPPKPGRPSPGGFRFFFTSLGPSSSRERASVACQVATLPFSIVIV